MRTTLLLPTCSAAQPSVSLARTPHGPFSTAAIVVALVALASGCSTVYRDTWQPMTAQDVYPRVVRSALVLEPSDVALVEQAGGTLIGFHATRRKYALRAGSVGGTHFAAVAGDHRARTLCASGWCSTTSGYRPSRVAVFRVEPEKWRALPPHLVPPTGNVEESVSPPVTRDGCSVSRSWGRVDCSNSWQLRSHARP